MLHAVVVREGEDGKLYLVAGERRLRAITDIHALGGTFSYENTPVPSGSIPVVSLGELDELAREEAELEENTQRADLSWQELAEATDRLTKFRRKQAAVEGTPEPTVAEMAQEIRGSSEGYHQDTVRKELIVAKYLDNPEVRGAKTLKEAFKVIKKTEQVKQNKELAEKVGKIFSGASHTLLNTDSLLWLESCPADSFDVILTDPPYGMGADEFGDSGGIAAGPHAYSDSVEVFQKCLAAAAKHFYRIAKAQAHLYWFCDIDKFAESRAAFLAAGWEVHRTPLIWHKLNGQRVPWPDYGPRRNYELILYAVKGKRPVTHIYSDVVAANSDKNLGHAAQKPVAVYNNLLQRSVRPGDAVLDCFGGSGPIIEAGHELKCVVTYIEMLPENYAIAVKRLETVTAQQPLI